MEEQKEQEEFDEFEAVFQIKKPQSDVPFNYKIGWWMADYQKHLKILDMDCDVRESRNGVSVVRIRIVGKVKCQKQHRPYIKEVHLTEKLLKSKGKYHIGEIELQPIVSTHNTPEYRGEWVAFTLSQELDLRSIGEHKNLFWFICGDIREQVIIVQDRLKILLY